MPLEEASWWVWWQHPMVFSVVKAVGDSALNILCGVWFMKTDFAVLRETLLPQIKETFDAEGIEIPFPHMTLYAGGASDPFPVAVKQVSH